MTAPDLVVQVPGGKSELVGATANETHGPGCGDLLPAECVRHELAHALVSPYEIVVPRIHLKHAAGSSAEAYRLPRADTVAAVATELKVSLDWLLGLSQVDKLGADILHESLQVAPNAQHPYDEQLIAWFEEAAGAKIRYVPNTLPVFAKTGDVLRHKYRTFSARSIDRALVEAREKRVRLRESDTYMEVCMPMQGMETFAEGNGIWKALPASSRAQQIERLAELVEDLYPRLRVYLFDGLTHYSIPYLIYGRVRLCLYVGQIHLVFNTAEHISVLNRQFDGLVRAAVVHSNEVGPYLRGLLPRIREHG